MDLPGPARLDLPGPARLDLPGLLVLLLLELELLLELVLVLRPSPRCKKGGAASIDPCRQWIVVEDGATMRRTQRKMLNR
jgi:hypothetical protein